MTFVYGGEMQLLLSKFSQISGYFPKFRDFFLTLDSFGSLQVLKRLLSLLVFSGANKFFSFFSCLQCIWLLLWCSILS